MYVMCYRHLADRDVDGRLCKDDFAVAMLLVRHAMTGKTVPSTLPVSLVPKPVSRAQDHLEPLPPSESHQVDDGQPDASGLHSLVVHDDELDRPHTPPPPYTEWVEEDL